MAKMIEELALVQETEATALSCAKAQKTVCMCACVLGLGVWRKRL